jgi:hypothetical protein
MSVTCKFGSGHSVLSGSIALVACAMAVSLASAWLVACVVVVSMRLCGVDINVTWYLGISLALLVGGLNGV